MDIEHLVENLGRDFLDFPAQSPNTRIIDKNINLTDRKEPTSKIVDIYDVGNEDFSLPARLHNLLGRLSGAF